MHARRHSADSCGRLCDKRKHGGSHIVSLFCNTQAVMFSLVHMQLSLVLVERNDNTAVGDYVRVVCREIKRGRGRGQGQFKEVEQNIKFRSECHHDIACILKSHSPYVYAEIDISSSLCLNYIFLKPDIRAQHWTCVLGVPTSEIHSERRLSSLYCSRTGWHTEQTLKQRLQ